MAPLWEIVDNGDHFQTATTIEHMQQSTMKLCISVSKLHVYQPCVGGSIACLALYGKSNTNIYGYLDKQNIHVLSSLNRSDIFLATKHMPIARILHPFDGALLG
jgi:hypothetical protein